MNRTQIERATGRELDAMAKFIQTKLAEAERALRCREQAAECWRGGSNESWKKAGCRMSKTERLEVATNEARIAVRYREEVEQYKGVLAVFLATAAQKGEQG